VAYLNCPSCRLTVYRSGREIASEKCPRCSATLGKVARLFRSKLPARLPRRERVTQT
jgi:Zn-finger nucleic acid-binding protein